MAATDPIYERQAPAWRSGDGATLKAAWSAYDLALAGLAILATTGGVNRFGIASPVFLLVYAMTLLRVMFTPTAFYAILVRNWPFFIYPAVCMASALWSLNRGESLASGIQLAMTAVIGILIASIMPMRRVFLVIFCVMSLTTLLSLLQWRTGVFGRVGVEDLNEAGVAGIFTQKNMLGRSCLVGLISAFGVLTLYRMREAFIPFAAIVMMAVMLFSVVISKSATSLILVILLFGFIAVLNTKRLGGGFVMLAVLLTMFGAVLPIVAIVADIDVIKEFLHAFGKNSTLTGRTELWAIAENVISHNWLIGVGQNAFWKSPDYAYYAYLAREIGGQTLASFHNVVLEILVGTGLFGLGAITIFVGTPIVRGFRLWIRTQDLGASVAMAITIGLTAAAFVTATMYLQHDLSTLLVPLFGAALLRADRESRPQPRTR